MNRQEYLIALRAIHTRNKEAGIRDMLASGAGYLSSGFNKLVGLGRQGLNNMHGWWHYLKEDPRTQRRLKALRKASKTLNDEFKVLTQKDIDRADAGIAAIDGIDRTYHAIDNDTEMKSGVRSVLDAAKDIARTGNVTKYLKKGVNKGHDAIKARYPSIQDTEDAVNVLLNGPEKKSSYSLGGGIAKILLKQAMYKRAGEKDFTTEDLDPESPEFKRLRSAQSPVYGPLTPKEQLAQDELGQALQQYDEDIKDVQDLEREHQKVYNEFHSPRKYYDTIGEMTDDALQGKFDMGKVYHPYGPFGIGNTWFGEGVRSVFDADKYYNTDAFSDGYYGPLRKVLNDVGWGVAGTGVNMIPWGIGNAIKPFNYYALGEASIPLAVMNHLGEDLGQARGALMNEEGFNRQGEELTGLRNRAYSRKDDALDRRNQVFAEEENWSSDNLDNSLYRAAANSQYGDLHMMNLAKSDPKEFTRIMAIQNPQVPKSHIEAMAKQMHDDAKMPIPMPNSVIPALRSSADFNDMLSKMNR